MDIKQGFLCISSALLFVSAFPASVYAVDSTSTPEIATSQVATSSVGIETATTSATTTPVTAKPTNVEEVVRTYFADVPAMIGIARCESKFRQYADSGAPLRGGLGRTMIGVFQFSEGVHAKKAASLGYDIYTLDGNLKYAEYLYKKLGTDPWISSFSCWNGDALDSTIVDAENLSRNLHFGQAHPQVKLLQALLNKNGFTIAASGPGSKGNETEVFGNLTRAAVRAFQCAEKIVCGGDEYSTGYGLVNKKTRTALLDYKAPQKPDSRSTKKTEVKPTPIVLNPEEREKKLKELRKLLVELQRQLAELLAQP